MPDELIDAQWEGGRVFVTNADTIARPLRLGRDEALTLMVGLRALAAVPGLGERDAIERAMAKLEGATGASAEAAARVEVAISEGVEADLLADARRAVETRRRVHLTYFVPSRDESTERDVDPMRVVNLDSRWYLEGWCHRAQDTRLFRMDRITGLEVLDEDGTPPADATLRDPTPARSPPVPTTSGSPCGSPPGATWVSDYYPVESVETDADGSQTVTLRTADTLWLRRLVWRLGGLGTVVDPPDLAAAVRTGAEGPWRPTVRPRGARTRAGRVHDVWWWVLIWVLLVVIATAYLATRAWGVWGQLKELNAEVGRASETLATLQSETDRLGERGPAPELPCSVTPGCCGGNA